MTQNFKNCYGLATGRRKLYFSPPGCRKPENVVKHWAISILVQ